MRKSITQHIHLQTSQDHLVALECTNPVSGSSIAEHGQGVFAGTGKEVAVLCYRAANDSKTNEYQALQGDHTLPPNIREEAHLHAADVERR